MKVTIELTVDLFDNPSELLAEDILKAVERAIQFSNDCGQLIEIKEVE